MSSDAMRYFVGALTEESEQLGFAPLSNSRTQSAVQEVSSEKAEASLAQPGDDKLLCLVAACDREALSLIFQRYARRVRNVGYRILKDDQEAEDLVQEVFLFIYRKADQFNPELGTASSWIIHIAYHRAFDRRRYLISRHFYDGADLDESKVSSVVAQPPPLLWSGTMGEFLGKDLIKRYEQRLSSGQRRVIELYFFGGHTFDEVAEIMGISLSNVRSHYYRGLERLRRYVLPENFRTQ